MKIWAELGVRDKNGVIQWHKNILLYSGLERVAQLLFAWPGPGEASWSYDPDIPWWRKAYFTHVVLGASDASSSPDMDGLQLPIRGDSSRTAAGILDLQASEIIDHVDHYEWRTRAHIEYTGDATTAHEWSIMSTDDPQKAGSAALNRGLIEPGFVLDGDVEVQVRVNCSW